VARYNTVPDGGTPNAHFDFLEDSVGGFPSGSMVDYYTPIVNQRLNVSSPLTLDASYAISGVTGNVQVTVTVDQAVTTTNNWVRIVVIEDDVHDHDNMARLMTADAALNITQPGETQTVARAFAVDPGWKVNDLEIIAFVQSDNGTRPVLQSAKAEAAYNGSITVNVEPAGLGADWTLDGPNGFSLPGEDSMQLAVFDEGDYTLSFGDVPGWTAPAPGEITQTLTPQGELVYTGVYSGGPFTAVLDGPLGDAGPARGVALVDFDADGDLDIHVVNSGAADLLLRNDAGVFTDVAAGLAADSGAGMAAVWADYDNDGDPDFYLARDGVANSLVRNDGGVFVDATIGALGNTGAGRGVAWADFDLDGLLDLYVCNDGQANVLFRNYGPAGDSWFFLDQSTGVNDAGGTQSASWGDFDDDGDPDLVITNAFTADRLFENAGAFGFNPVTNSNINNLGAGSGVDWGDFENDGDLDLYMATFGGSDRILRQTTVAWAPQLSTPASAVAATRAGLWADMDNDGDLDVYQAKGSGQFDRLLRNEGAGVFTEIPLGVAETGGDAQGAAWGDVDGDGDMDLYLANDGTANVLLRNEAQANGNHWLELRLRGTTCNAMAVGATVRVTAGGVTQRREVRAGNGYLSQGSAELHFGLGANAAVDQVEIRWPDGEVQILAGAAVDARTVVVQGQSTGVEDGDHGAAPAVFRLHRAYPNPFNPSTTLAFELPAPARVDLEIYDVSGRRVRTLLREDARTAGRHDLVWDGADDAGRTSPAGVYLVRLRAGEFRADQQVVLVK